MYWPSQEPELELDLRNYLKKLLYQKIQKTQL